MKIVILMIVAILTSCSEAPVEPVKKQTEVKKNTDKDHILKGYQDNLQKAKDMDKKVLKTVEDNKRKIDDPSKK
jgi:hypothetical protein